jgi:DNA polymerase-3 subunit alpha/error-prone DNA polymerase
MEKMPFIANPRYRETDAESSQTQERLREDVSMTQREPYPQEQEINLPRHKMVYTK